MLAPTAILCLMWGSVLDDPTPAIVLSMVLAILVGSFLPMGAIAGEDICGWRTFLVSAGVSRTGIVTLRFATTSVLPSILLGVLCYLCACRRGSPGLRRSRIGVLDYMLSDDVLIICNQQIRRKEWPERPLDYRKHSIHDRRRDYDDGCHRVGIGVGRCPWEWHRNTGPDCEPRHLDALVLQNGSLTIIRPRA